MTVQARPFSPETLAERWNCSAGLIYKLVRDGSLQSFRPGTLIRISAAEVERFECQTTASNDCGEGSPLSIATEESGSDDNSPPRIGRARRQKPESCGQGLTIARGQSGAV